MNSQVVQSDTRFLDLANRLEQMSQEMRKAKDDIQAGKLQQLIDKARQGEMSIAFCGHFSAGKSTMINTLLGRELLPSNPIPTSANVVKLRGGEPAARVYTRHSGVLAFDPDTEMEKLKKYAIDGDTVDWVEICYPTELLSENTSLLDTPGIDSTDAAHKIATESALHLADVVIYMMDYNHVQAEENFHFTKTLKDRGKPLYLVINMIDKHVDFELDFDSYKESVEEAFATWNIPVDGIFYTSLAEPDHPENQYDAFLNKIKECFDQRETLLHDSVVASAYHLIDEHVRYLSREHAEERQALEEKLQTQINGVETDDRMQVLEAIRRIEQKLFDMELVAKQAYDQMDQELTSLLDNARLTYYSTNEAAESYLESRKPGFKVGFLFAGKKTEEEREARLQALLADFSEKVSTNLDWHFKQLMTKFPEMFGLRNDEYHAEVHALHVPITADFLASQVKEGAASREYVLNYCKDISNGIKAEYRRVGLSFMEKITTQITAAANSQKGKLKEQLQSLQSLLSTHEALYRLTESETAAGERLRTILVEGVTV